MTLIRLHGDAPSEAHSGAIVAGRALEEQIQSIVSMSCGPAIRSDSHDWDLAFEFAFSDAAGFEAFAAHGAHDEFVKRHVHPYAEVVMSVDYDDGRAHEQRGESHV